MSQEPEKQSGEQAGLQHAAEHEKPARNGNHVMTYLVILFGAAFLLMLFSYLMQQRQNAENINTLSQSVSAVQSLEDLIKEKDDLEDQVLSLKDSIEDLQRELDDTKTQLSQVQAENALQDAAIRALDQLRYLEELYGKKHYKACREQIDAFLAEGLDACLPDTTGITGEDVPSPVQRFKTIYDALY